MSTHEGTARPYRYVIQTMPNKGPSDTRGYTAKLTGLTRLAPVGAGEIKGLQGFDGFGNTEDEARRITENKIQAWARIRLEPKDEA
jgi:hypothetical protein